MNTTSYGRNRWDSSNRKSRLPANWNHLRSLVLRRDSHRCKIGDEGCRTIATDVDHIVAGDNHAPENLQAACSWCHNRKSSREGNTARRRKAERRFRPVERHPGSR